MSQEMLEALRQGHEMINAGDLDGFLAILSPDVVWEEAYLGVDIRSYRGREGVREWWETGAEAMEESHWEIVRVLASSQDAIVAEVRYTGRGVGSGAEVTARLFQAIRLRHDGLADYVGGFPDASQALEAVGLSE